MVEREHRAPIATFYAPGPWSSRVELGADAAHHASVKRLVIGDVVRLSSGDGRRALAVISELGKRILVVEADLVSIETQTPPPRVELWAPVADRDRMLSLAEKAVELGVSVWCPILYARSRSVSPRGEGENFREKVRLRQVGALEQSGSVWLPELRAERSLTVALEDDAATNDGSRILLDTGGEPLGAMVSSLGAPVRIALGPEGGLEESERAELMRRGWRTASLGANVLRFETAGIAALAIVRSHLS